MRLSKSRGQASLALPWLCSLYLLPFWLWISTSCTPHPRCSSLLRSPFSDLPIFFSHFFHFPPRMHHQPSALLFFRSLCFHRLSLRTNILVTFPEPLCSCPSHSLNSLRNRRSPSRPEAPPLLLTRGLQEAGLRAKAPPAGQVQCDRRGSIQPHRRPGAQQQVAHGCAGQGQLRLRRNVHHVLPLPNTGFYIFCFLHPDPTCSGPQN